MNPRNDLALKEWAVVVEALLDGRQTVLLRKGGVAEGPSPFAVEDREFWLYPTFVHQAAESVKPAWRTALAEAVARKPATGTLVLPGYAEVVEAVPLTSLDEMARFDARHIWSPDYLRKRWDWNPHQPIWALVLKVSRLAAPVTLPERPEYGGCKSWVRLAESVPTEGLTTALDGA